MSYVDNNLMIGEEVVYNAKIHWIVYLIPWIYIIIGTIFLFMLSNFSPIPPEYDSIFLKLISGLLFLFFMPIGIYVLINNFIFAKTTELVITNKRIIAKFGLIRRDTMELNHNKVEGLSVHQGIIERLFDSGTIVVHGTGGTSTPIPSIDNPLVFRKNVMAILEKNH